CHRRLRKTHWFAHTQSTGAPPSRVLLGKGKRCTSPRDLGCTCNKASCNEALRGNGARGRNAPGAADFRCSTARLGQAELDRSCAGSPSIARSRMAKGVSQGRLDPGAGHGAAHPEGGSKLLPEGRFSGRFGTFRRSAGKCEHPVFPGFFVFFGGGREIGL